jgi:hypothetical protein
MTLTSHGIIRGRMVVLDDDSPTLPDGTAVLVTAIPQTMATIPISDAANEFHQLEDAEEFEGASAGKAPITAAELWAVLRALPQVSAEDMDELERSIEAGRQPMSQESPFADLEREDAAD